MRNQEIKQNMPKNYGFNIFDYEAHKNFDTHSRIFLIPVKSVIVN